MLSRWLCPVWTMGVAGLLSLVSVAGCDPTTPPEDDAGRPRIDAVVPDPVPPRILSTTPTAGDFGVGRQQPLVIRFTEPMDRRPGRIDVPGERSLDTSDGEWNETGNAITIPPTAPWPSGEVTVTITTEFADPSGNRLEEAFALTFTTLDDIRPTATASEPAEGASGLSARIDAVSFTFDEEMDRTVGGIDVLGGSGTVGERTWSDDRRTVTFAMEDLEYDRDYDIQLRDFRDISGNRLDGVPYLGDGQLDFTTGPDTDAPQATRSEPAEGQLDVNPAVSQFVLVTFDEPMDDSVTTLSLSSGGASVDVDAEWTAADQVLRIDVRGALEFDSTYSIDLSALTDRAGNALAAEPYLVDGRLDFTVSSDAFAPFVRASTPGEASADVPYLDTTTVSLELSEAMDTTVRSATLSGGPAPIDLLGVWTDDVHLEFDVTDQLTAGTSYTLDLRGLLDSTGNALDATHSYLRDGQLNFVTGPPSGESCRDPLTLPQATVVDGAYTWEVAPGQFVEREGGTDACQAAPGSGGPDALIRFDKVSADVAGGGQLLRVQVNADNNSAEFDVAIVSGADCDPSASPTRCVAEALFSTVYADVPAGPVWIWVARSVNSVSNGFTVSVAEVAAPRPEGEACDAPYTTASAIYAAPSGAGEPHVWTMGENVAASMDIAPWTTRDTSVVSCDADGHGIDAVVRYTKSSADSILRVAVTPGGSASHTDVNLEVLSSCDATDAGAARYGCVGPVGTGGGDLLVDAPAGDLFFWLTAADTSPTRSSTTIRRFPATALEITEITGVTAGEVCSRAMTLTAPSTSVTGSSDQSFGAPSCFPAGANVEWYRISTTEPVLIVQGDAAGGLGLVDVTSGETLACSPDGQARPVARFLAPGSEVCVAVEMGRSIGALSVTELAYSGVGAAPGVPLNIGRPLTANGVEDSIIDDRWMAIGAGTLFMYYSASPLEALDAPITGNERAAYRNSADGLSSVQFGQAGLFVGDQLFSLDDTASATANRVYRIWDGASPVYAPTAWDVTPNYRTEDVAAATAFGTRILFVTEGATPSFYSIDTTVPSTAVLMGTSERLRNAVGLAADDTFVYVAAEHVDTGQEGIYRIARAALATPSTEPVDIAPGVDFLGGSSPSREVALYVDQPVAPTALYFRNAQGHVEAVLDPGATPLHIGEIIRLGVSADSAMGFDPDTGSLYLFETETESNGHFVRFDR